MLAANGREGVDIAVENRPDVILMDVRMPVMDGITATRLLRNQPETASTPVICMSGYLGSDYSVSDALAAGFIDVFPKPIEWKKLEELLERLASGSRSRE
jgi:CheY-like chemotaxis protein